MKKTSKIAQRGKGAKKNRGIKRPRPKRGHAATVLLVDDEDDIRNMAQLALEDHGYRVLAAHGGAAALALWAQRSSEIDLVITDMLMPSIDGATLTRALRRNRPDLPIVLASGAGSDDFADELRGLEFCGHLPKPYTRHQLVTAVCHALTRASAKQPRGEPGSLPRNWAAKPNPCRSLTRLTKRMCSSSQSTSTR